MKTRRDQLTEQRDIARERAMSSFHALQRVKSLFRAGNCPLGMAGGYCADYSDNLAKWKASEMRLFEYDSLHPHV